MKKEHLTTINESTEIGLRNFELLGDLKKTMLKGLLPITFFFVLIGFVVRTADVWFVCGFLYFIYALSYLLSFRFKVETKIRKSIIDSLGTDQPILKEYELTDSHFVVRNKSGNETKIAWKNVKKLVETNTHLEITVYPLAIALIPKQIFNNNTEIESWKKFIIEHMESNLC
ncbi:MAG: hypothetical protein PF692_06770 [Kiritimatiellae bacterium]|nr:hypothetical protein [Kiritimatiellia bacterium]